MEQNMAHDLNEKQRTKDVILEENVNFTSLLLHSDIQKGLAASGFKKPSPIQFKSIPLGRCGFDLVVKSKSGTGKTLVFATIALETVNCSKDYPQVLVLVPTREIAVQIQDVLRNIGRYIDGLLVESFIGGLPVDEDLRKLKRCHVAVGAPGRIKHLINLGALWTKYIRLFVLDEADKLLEPSFQNDINEIYDTLPLRKQMIAASATYPKELAAFLTKYMQSPTHVTSENETPLLLGLKQFVTILKANTLNAVQQMKTKNEILLEIFSKVSFTQCLVFTNYQTRTESVSNFLNQKGWDSSFISAASEQAERLEAIKNLKCFKNRILLSTDLTSRGIDAPNVDLVINYDLPHDAVTYLHRMGRAGRYGSSGICINFALEGGEIAKLQNILGTIGSTNLSVSKLPPLNGTDLWQINPDDLEQIWGVVPSETSNEVNDNIKKEVFTLKQKNTKELVKQKVNKIKKKERGKKDTLDGENLLNSFISECNIEDDSKKRKIEIEDVKSDSVQHLLRTKKKEIDDLEISSSVETEDLLSRLASGNCVIDDESKRRKIESEDVTDTKDLQHILRIKKQATEDIFPFVEAEDLFTSLISSETSLNINSLISNNEEKIKLESEENLLTKKEEEGVPIESSTYIETEDSFLISGEDDNDSKKRKRNESPIKVKKENCKYSTFSKNKALLGISRILSDTHLHIDTDLVESVDDYLKLLKNSDFSYETMSVEEILCLHSDTSTKLLKEENVSEDVDVMEDIFRIAYKCTISSEGRSWLNHLPSEELQRFQDCCKAELVAVSTGSEEGDYDMDEEYEEEEERNEQTDDAALQWIPAEPTWSNPSEHFAQCFEDCSNVLWQTGLTFETVADFDDWFYQWQHQLQSVRNYVQQNIYVEEMSKYQQSRLTDK